MKEKPVFSRRVFYFCLLIIGIAGICDSLILPFFSSMNLGVLLPGAAGAVLVIFASDKLWLGKKMISISNSRLAGAVRAAVLVFCVLFFCTEVLLLIKSRSNEAGRGRILMVPGAGLRGHEPSHMLRLRLDRAAVIVKRNSGMLVIVSGGRGMQEDVPEADAMAGYLMSVGVPAERILKERESASTHENFRFTGKLLERRFGVRPRELDVVTSGFHVFRAGLIAEREGFKARFTAAPTPASVVLNCYMREFFAVVKTLLFDR